MTSVYNLTNYIPESQLRRIPWPRTKMGHGPLRLPAPRRRHRCHDGIQGNRPHRYGRQVRWY